MASFSKRLRRLEATGQSISELMASEDELRKKVRQELQEQREDLRELADEFNHFRGEAT